MSIPSHNRLRPTSRSFKLTVNKGTHETLTHDNVNSHDKSNITSLSTDLSNVSVAQPYYSNFVMYPSVASDCSVTLTNTQSSECSYIIKMKLPDLQTLMRLKAKSLNADAINKEEDKARALRYKAAEIFITKQEDELLKQQVQDWNSLYHPNEISVKKTTQNPTLDDQNRTISVIELPRGVPKLPIQQIRKSSVTQDYTTDPQVDTGTKGQSFISEHHSTSRAILVESATNPQSNIATLNGSQYVRSGHDNQLVPPSQPDKAKRRSKQIIRQTQLQGFELWVTTQCQLTDPVSRDNSLQSMILFEHYTNWCQQPTQKDITAITSGSDFGRLMNKRLPGHRYEKSKATYYSGIILK